MKKTLSELHIEFLKQQEFTAKLREDTLRGYKQAFDLLNKIMPDLTIDMLTSEIMTEFFKRLEKRTRILNSGKTKQGIKVSTVATYRSKLSSFFDWLVNKELLRKNPFSEIPYPDVNYDDKKWLKKEEVEKIFTHINLHSASPFLRNRNHLIFSILLHSGLRRGELINLRIIDIDITRKTLKVRPETSKSKIERTLPLNSATIKCLKEYLEDIKKRSGSCEYLLRSENGTDRFTAHGLKHLIATIVKMSGVKFTAHQFRHTFAVNMLFLGADLAKLKQLMGHKDIRMTAAYLRCLPTSAMRGDIERLNFDNLI